MRRNQRAINLFCWVAVLAAILSDKAPNLEVKTSCLIIASIAGIILVGLVFEGT